MPLFNYRCNKCGLVVEKFVSNVKKIPNLECKNCSGREFTKIMGVVFTKTWLNAKDTFNQKISPEVERIREDVAKGKDKTFSDIAGD